MKRKYSPSAIKTYESCPKKYDLGYNQNIWPPPGAPDHFTAFGYIIHEIAEHYTGNNPKNAIKIVNKYKQYLTDEFKLELLPTIKNLYKWCDKNIKDDTLREYRLELKEDDLWIGGIIDDLMPDRKLFTDYKSGYPATERHMFQMKLYATILYKKWKCEPKDIKCILYYPKVDVQDFIMFKNKEIYDFEKELKEKINEIENRKEWPEQPGFHCRWCDYQTMKLCKTGEKHD